MAKVPIELYVEPDVSDDVEKTLFVEAENTVDELLKRHQDITGAAINITAPAENRETQFIYEATVVFYARPSNIAATEKDGDVEATLRRALRAAARQVREKREKLSNS